MQNVPYIVWFTYMCIQIMPSTEVQTNFLIVALKKLLPYVIRTRGRVEEFVYRLTFPHPPKWKADKGVNDIAHVVVSKSVYSYTFNLFSWADNDLPILYNQCLTW